MADVKITALPARSAVATTDILPVVDAAAGTPATQKATVAQVRAALVPIVLTADVTGVLPSANAPSHAGDVTGTHAATVVARVNGATAPVAGALTTGNVLQVSGVSALSYGALNLAGGSNFVTGTLPAANQAAQTLAGDVTGLTSATTVVKVNGASVPAAGALTTGNSAYVSGVSALTYSALNLAGGTGWVTGVLPVGNQASQTMAGDVTGTTAASTVAKVNGATVPAAGALTTGNAPYVSGVSALTYSALNLAGGAGWVTGVLPSANAPSHSGDVTGAHSATVVAKVNGATIPASGALTTGNAPYVSGVSALTYSALNLAGGAGWVTGVLPAANVTQATGTGFPHVTAGALDAASIKVDTTNSAHVTVPATANGVVTSSGSVLQQASGVLAGTNFISIGASPAATGYIRLPYNSGTVPFLYVNSAGSDFAVLEIVGSNVKLSSSAFGTIIDGSATSLRAVGASYLELNSGFVGAAKPIVGDSGNSSPYSVHGRMPVHALGAATTYTVIAAEFAFQVLQFSSSSATLCTIMLPDPATEAGSYFKDIDVTQCNVSQSVVFKAGAGTRTASITGGGAGVPGVPKRIFVSPGCVDLAPG